LIETILNFFLVFHCLFVCLLLAAISLKKRTKQEPFAKRPMVSVIVAARNEEKNISRCLESLLKQEYPHYEIIIVDDRSRDRTADIVSEHLATEKQLKLLRVKENISGLAGKQNALHEGILRAGGDIILCTDADCAAPPQWISHMLEALGRDNLFVFGITKISPAKTLWQKFQAMELQLLFKVAGSLASLGKPGSCMGNNIGFRKQSYLQTGGFPSIGYHVVEDFALLNAFVKKGFRVVCASGRIQVETKAEDTIKKWFSQHLRWLGGSIFPKTWLFWALLPTAITSCAFLPYVASGHYYFSTLGLFVLKLILDFILVFWKIPVMILPGFILMLIDYFIGPPIFLVLYLFRKTIVWKEEKIPLRRK
jgi:cellulose synthase/poly-beta-1,6-N-acetylglucosamine synthase-like glycosyltransferase